MTEQLSVPPPAPSAEPDRDTARAAARLRQLTQVSRAVTYATSADEILKLVAEQAADLLEVQKSVLMLADEQGLLEVRAAYGIAGEVVERFREPLDETLIGRMQGLLGVHETTCFLGVPLVVRGQVIGLLAVLRPHGRPCTEEEEVLLSALADQTAAPLEVARLDVELRRGLALAKEKALATLAHDLRSPLQAIEGFAQLVEQEILGPVTAEQRGALERIRMSGRHLLALQESMLEMAQVSGRTPEAERRPTVALTVIQEAVAIVRADAEARGHTLEVDDGADVRLHADPDRLRRVLINLLSNAIKYTPPGGHIRVRSASSEEEGARSGTITVSDTGVGIAPGQLEAVFQPYYRINGASASGAKGAGLGLAICRELVQQMGGEVLVASRPGVGSTFTVRLPLAE